MARSRRLSICERVLHLNFYVFVYHSEKLIKANEYISNAPIVYHVGAFYIFGGGIDYNGSTNVIGRLDVLTLTWRKAGELNNARWGHGAIFNGDVFIVAGGYGNLKTEVCSISNSSVVCLEQTPTLDYYRTYPEMFLVTDQFCKYY